MKLSSGKEIKLIPSYHILIICSIKEAKLLRLLVKPPAKDLILWYIGALAFNSQLQLLIPTCYLCSPWEVTVMAQVMSSCLSHRGDLDLISDFNFSRVWDIVDIWGLISAFLYLSAWQISQIPIWNLLEASCQRYSLKVRLETEHFKNPFLISYWLFRKGGNQSSQPPSELRGLSPLNSWNQGWALWCTRCGCLLGVPASHTGLLGFEFCLFNPASY